MCVQVLVWKLCIFTPRIHVILYFLICYFSVDWFALLQTPLCSCCYLETSAHPGSGQPRSVLSGWKHGGTARPELVVGGLLCARACMMRAAGTTQFFPPPEPIIILSHFPTQCRQRSVTERVDECVKGRLMCWNVTESTTNQEIPAAACPGRHGQKPWNELQNAHQTGLSPYPISHD